MITSLRLQNFRSYSDSSFDFEPDVNIIVGPNASGKTTIIEAIMTICGGKSFKARDSELLQTGAEWARLDMQTDSHERILKLVMQPEGLQKTISVDANTYKRLPSSKNLPVVLFEPNDLQLLHSSPEGRRDFMDTILEQIKPEYGPLLRQYRRVLAQRNSLLKQQPTKTDQFFVWNLRLSELGGALATARVALLEQFNTQISGLYSDIAATKTDVSLTYSTKQTTANYESSLLRALERSFALDQARGFTGSGPHRDDMIVLLNGRPAQETASRGEIRTLVLALKMLHAESIEQATGGRPILLLDDVFSELDGRRRQALVQFLQPYQAFITTTDADVVLEHFLGKATVIAL